MSGFVYIWRDRKHNRYYIGSHWGDQNDGYVCSSRWMRKAYNRRPEDFNRRIISRVSTNRKDLLTEEERWLKMIKPEEKKIRYYNLNLGGIGHWTAYDNSLTVKEKIKKARAKQVMSEAQLQSLRTFSKKPKTDEVRNKISQSNMGKKNSVEHNEKVRQARLGSKYSDETNAKKGRPFSDERKRQQSERLKAFHLNKRKQ